MTKYYLIETMPDCHRDSHRAANNWGRYPHNGAEREIVPEGLEPDGSDEYDRVIREATEAEYNEWNKGAAGCVDSAAALERLRDAAAGGEPIGWAGPDREIAYLETALETESDPAVRARMQARLETVQRLGNDADPTK